MKYNKKTITKVINRNLWCIRYRENGQQKTIYGKTQKQVIDNYKLALKQKNKKVELIPEQPTQEKTIQTPTKPQYTLIEWYNKYIELYKINKVRDTTIQRYTTIMNKFKKLFKKNIEDLTAIELQSELNKLPTNSMQQKAFIVLNCILEKAKNNEIISKNVMKQLDKPKYKAEEKNALTLEQEKQFIQNCKKHIFGNYFLITLYQGLRRGETRALKVNDIDFVNNKLKIDESISTNKFKVSQTKNQQSNRVMPLFEKSKEILKELVKGKKDNDFIFTIGVNQIDTALKNITSNIKINHITPHILRHTFITRCQEKNIPLFVLQSWVGHERGSVVTTKIYTHLNEETNNKYAEIINKN